MSPVDNLWTTRRESAQLIHNLATYLTMWIRCLLSQRAAVADSSRVRSHLLPLSCLILGSLAIQAIPAQATNADQYRLYAHSRIINNEQYICLSKIIYKESRWNPKAKNGSHFGLGQMRSQHYRNLDPYRQIDATIKYIDHRYGSMCNAWRFHQKVGHY
jgi:hypothetical protein